MVSKNALAWLKREKDARLAVDEIDDLITAVAQADDAEARLMELSIQIETARNTLADIRQTAERENRERKERIEEARAKIIKAEADAQARVEALEHELVERLATLRQEADRQIADARAEADRALLEIRAERSREAALLSEIKARRLEAQRALAPLVAEPQA